MGYATFALNLSFVGLVGMKNYQYVPRINSLFNRHPENSDLVSFDVLVTPVGCLQQGGKRCPF